jgi:hypothetical protein
MPSDCTDLRKAKVPKFPLETVYKPVERVYTVIFNHIPCPTGIRGKKLTPYHWILGILT